MRAELITIGDEILIGQIVNTNAVWMAKQLNQCGISVVHMCSVSDEASAIIAAFDAAKERADLVLITGGLGPTKDDITKKTIADYFQLPLITDEDVLKDVSDFFAKRGRELSPLNKAQALVPEGCRVIRNKQGTAPGMWIEHNGKHFISMPGVPHEMEGMMSDVILPYLIKNYELPKIYHFTVLTQGIGESALAEVIETWEDGLAQHGIKLAYLPQIGRVRLRLSTVGPDLAVLKTKVAEQIEKLKSLAGKWIYGYEPYGEASIGIEHAVSELLRARKETIALAESCTGGYISSLITAIPGASELFKGAIVPYTNEGKHQLLQVEPHLFTTVGAVSQECVVQLAENVRKRFNSTWAISVSGIAGPAGATSEKPVGTVWIAVANAEQTITKKYVFGDHRQRNIEASAAAALGMLKAQLLKTEET
jgi:nicotinamide-nucleotide amidase